MRDFLEVLMCIFCIVGKIIGIFNLYNFSTRKFQVQILKEKIETDGKLNRCCLFFLIRFLPVIQKCQQPFSGFFVKIFQFLPGLIITGLKIRMGVERINDQITDETLRT